MTTEIVAIQALRGSSLRLQHLVQRWNHTAGTAALSPRVAGLISKMMILRTFAIQCKSSKRKWSSLEHSTRRSSRRSKPSLQGYDKEYAGLKTSRNKARWYRMPSQRRLSDRSPKLLRSQKSQNLPPAPQLLTIKLTYNRSQRSKERRRTKRKRSKRLLQTKMIATLMK